MQSRDDIIHRASKYASPRFDRDPLSGRLLCPVRLHLTEVGQITICSHMINEKPRHRTKQRHCQHEKDCIDHHIGRDHIMLDEQKM